LLLGICAVAAAVRFIGIGAQALWLDESFTWRITGGSLTHLFNRVSALETTPPLSYLLIWLSRQAFGSSEFALRFAPAVAGVLTVPAVWLGGRRLFGQRAGLFAAALTAVSPFMWWYSQEARAYSLAALLCALMFAAYAYRVTGGGTLALVGWAAAAAAAVATQYSTAAVVIATFTALLTTDRNRWKQVALAGLAPLLAAAALFNLAMEQAGHGMTDWIASIPLGERFAQLFLQPWAGTATANFGVPLYTCAALSLLMGCALVVIGRRQTGQRREALGNVGWILLASALLLSAFLLVGGDRVLARYYIVIWPIAAVAAAAAIAAVRIKAAITVIALVCGVMLALVIRIEATPSLQRLDWRPVAAALGPAPLHGRLIIIQNYPYWQALQPYMKGLEPFGVLTGQYPVSVEVVTIRAGEPSSCWWCTARGADGVFPPAKAVGFFPIAVSITAGRFTITSYRSSNPFMAERQRIPISGEIVAASLASTLKGGVVLFQQGPPDPYLTAIREQKRKKK